jgi:hypothetical protein
MHMFLVQKRKKDIRSKIYLLNENQNKINNEMGKILKELRDSEI